MHYMLYIYVRTAPRAAILADEFAKLHSETYFEVIELKKCTHDTVWHVMRCAVLHVCTVLYVEVMENVEDMVNLPRIDAILSTVPGTSLLQCIPSADPGY